MSGRAGRRGKDDQGLAIIMLDDAELDKEQAQGMFVGQAGKLNSAFQIQHNTVLNLMKVGAHSDYTIRRSFHQFQTIKQVLELQESKDKLEAELSELKNFRAKAEKATDFDYSVEERIAVKKEIQQKEEEVRVVTKNLENMTKASEEQQGGHQFMVYRQNLESMKGLLRSLDFVSHDGKVRMKGRMACELSSADGVLLTELVFNGVFDGMEADRIVALCSFFVFAERSGDIVIDDSNLLEGLSRIQNVTRAVALCMERNKMPVDVEEYVEKTRPPLIDIVMKWLNGTAFAEIMKDRTDLYEGSVVKAIRHLEKLSKELSRAARNAGNEELEEKLADVRSRLRRGIIFAESLYHVT
eukprot:gnl/TRDRNA2_/TRDRNA2_81256_c0_seq1.p1 gnl/TRDRNA2_/TRDRNA2_81256_c0~~gnl/TRDRNA2_/TRDRNA2_81256_c0_seq1.p1  ORF type:complete len:363 (-),score=74.72 gnl/TRDRNA2_/TRDRNA2_81256_c0_seq1:548-1612(-)